MEKWEPKAPRTLWATPGLLRDGFTFLTINSSEIHKNTIPYMDLSKISVFTSVDIRT